VELYYKYQPVTWHVGVIEAYPKAVAASIQARYIPYDELEAIYQEKGSVDKGLAALEPLACPAKFLLVETVDGRTVIFRNSWASVLELPIWNAAQDLKISAYHICNIPNTISRDHRSGAWGARVLEYRTPDNPYNQEPTFGVHLVNDAGRWRFYRFGEKLDFEDQQGYKAIRKPNRFTVEMLVRYCRELGIPVYDRNWYSSKWMIIERKLRPNEKGISYQEAAAKLRITQGA
jgi:hypothetical protein